MHTIETIRPPGKSALRAEIDRFFAGLGQGFNAYLETLLRAKELERLSAMSDADLARLGIASRGDIVRYVFRDRFHT